MKALLTAKVGTFLVVSSVLALWTLLAAQHVQAHTDSLPRLSCSSSILPDDEFLDDVTRDITTDAAEPGDFNEIDSLTTKKGNDDVTDPDSGDSDYYYAKITVPALTAGELMVSDSEAGPSDAILCGRQGGDVTSKTDYSDHDKAEDARDDALKAAMEADVDAAKSGASVTTLMRDLRAAANELGDAADALRKVGTDDAADAAGTAEADEMTAADAADADDADERSLQLALEAAADALRDAAGVLGTAAEADHMGFDISALISSGDEEYVVVVAVPTGADTPALSVEFEGVMATAADAQNGQDGGSFTRNNQQITHTLKTTADTPGLLTVRTTGSAVDTIGTLNQGATKIAMDEGSGGNFEIVSPVQADTTYSLHVGGQARSERGDYGLKVEFGVATKLVDTPNDYDYEDTTRDDDMLEPGRADYFFFTVPATTYRFLTVQTQQHMNVTTETNTTGTLYGQAGQIVTDTNSGADDNFLLSAPISPGDYIVEVKGSSSSTAGEYQLVTTSTEAPSQGSAPDGIMTSTDNTVITNSAEVDPHSITVTKAGTLQVKTIGTAIDTVGVLYGPDGRQIATDDDSGDGMNFLITEYVEAGQYVVTVEGQTRTTVGAYTLVVNFIEGVDVEPTPGTGPVTGPVTGPGTGTAPDPDPTGNLDEPASGSTRSGIGLVRGWVCQDAGDGVEIRIMNSDGTRAATFTAPYGSERGDVDVRAECGRMDRDARANVGFAAQFNYNLLPAGTYTIEAFVGREQIGLNNDQTNTFRVVRIGGEFEIRLRSGRIPVEDFPRQGDTTILEWDQPSQNFQIVDTE